MSAHLSRIRKTIGLGITLISCGQISCQNFQLLLGHPDLAVCLEDLLSPSAQDLLGFRSLEVFQKIVVKKLRIDLAAFICQSVLRRIFLEGSQHFPEHGPDLI